MITIYNKGHLHIVDMKILNEIPYFHSIIHGHFMESGKEILEVDMNDEFLSLALYDRMSLPKTHIIDYINFLLFLGMNDTLDDFQDMIEEGDISPELMQYIIIMNDLRNKRNSSYYLRYFNDMFLWEGSLYYGKENEYPVLSLYSSLKKSSSYYDERLGRELFTEYFEDNIRESIINNEYSSIYGIFHLIKYGDDNFILFLLKNISLFPIDDFFIDLLISRSHLVTIKDILTIYERTSGVNVKLKQLLEITLKND